MGEQNFLNIEQIIPTKDSEEFMIGIADKVREEIEGATEEKNRHKVRREFWVEIIRAMATKSNLFQNISPGPYGWLSAGSGVRGLGFNFAASRKYGRAELYIERGNKEENMVKMENAFKEPLVDINRRLRSRRQSETMAA